MNCLNKHYLIRATRKEVFNALTNPQLIAVWSGSPAEMEAVPMGKFSFWEGTVHGINRIVTSRKIVQDWYQKDWFRPSYVTFLLNEGKGITFLELIHEEIPDRYYRDVDAGWDERFIGPIIRLVENIG